MSNFMKSLQFGYLKNKEKEGFFFSDDEEDDFDFKYIPANQLKNIIKDVRRQKAKTEEENAWASFVEKQDVEQLYYRLNEIDPNLHNANCFAPKSLEDSEHLRWEDNIFPEESLNKKSHLLKDNGAGSTNFLLTIPEEDLITGCNKSTDVKDRTRSNARKPSSAPGIKRRKDHSKRLIRAINDLDYNSTPEFSPDRLSDKEEIIYVRPDPTIVAKILGTQKKISEVLDEIAFRLGRIPLPDGDRDLHRRQQRVMEFSIRFARNYLYDLGRQVGEIRRHINAISPGVRKKIGRRGVTFHVQVIEQKLATAHQLLLQALSAYCKHIPSSVLKGHPGKLKEILQIVVDLKDFCEKIHLAPDCIGSGDMERLPLGKETDNKCSAILSKLRLSSDESPLISHTTRSPAATTMRSKRRNVRKQVANRFNMYNMEMRLPKNQPNRRTKSFAQKEKRKNNISVLKNNRPPTPELTHPSPVDCKSKEEMRNGVHKIVIPPKEDDIKTIMEIIPSDSETCSSIGQEKYEILDKNSRVKKLPQNFKNFEKSGRFGDVSDDEELSEKTSEVVEENLSNLVPVIADLMSLIRSNSKDSENKSQSTVPIETLLEIIQKYQKSTGLKEKSKSTDSPRTSSKNKNGARLGYKNGEETGFKNGEQSICKNGEQSICKNGEQLVYKNREQFGYKNEVRSGSKNMQLLCLQSEEDYKIPSKFSDASCQANEDYLREKRKARLIDLKVSDHLESRLLEYKQLYQSVTESSQMYCNHTQNKPWDIVAWVSDQLVNELIVDLSKELQMDDVIKKLFELEFQEL